MTDSGITGIPPTPAVAGDYAPRSPAPKPLTYDEQTDTLNRVSVRVGANALILGDIGRALQRIEEAVGRLTDTVGVVDGRQHLVESALDDCRKVVERIGMFVKPGDQLLAGRVAALEGRLTTLAEQGDADSKRIAALEAELLVLKSGRNAPEPVPAPEPEGPPRFTITIRYQGAPRGAHPGPVTGEYIRKEFAVPDDRDLWLSGRKEPIGNEEKIVLADGQSFFSAPRRMDGPLYPEASTTPAEPVFSGPPPEEPHNEPERKPPIIAHCDGGVYTFAPDSPGATYSTTGAALRERFQVADDRALFYQFPKTPGEQLPDMRVEEGASVLVRDGARFYTEAR